MAEEPPEHDMLEEDALDSGPGPRPSGADEGSKDSNRPRIERPVRKLRLAGPEREMDAGESRRWRQGLQDRVATLKAAGYNTSRIEKAFALDDAGLRSEWVKYRIELKKAEELEAELRALPSDGSKKGSFLKGRKEPGEKDEEEPEEKEEPEEMEEEREDRTGKKKDSPKDAIKGIMKDILVSAAIVGGLLLVLYLFSGVWPPMVVIESSSMMHGDDSQLGVIDTGDLTLVQKVDERGDIITYVEATCRTGPHYGFMEYGDYGNVIVYRKNGKAETPVIHRAMAWIEYNASASDPSKRFFRGDLPDIGVFNVSEYYINVTSYRPENYLKKERLVIQISAILARSSTPHSGFVTKGDHNIPYVDQWVLYVQGGVPVEPVKLEWIVGKAQGELPWFGLFKLWITGHDSKAFPESSVRNLIVTVIILVVVPILLDYTLARYKKNKLSRKDAGKGPKLK
jgi:signal peptidase I